MGLDPRIPGSQPEPKANAQPLSHPGVLGTILITNTWDFFKKILFIYLFIHERHTHTQRERERQRHRQREKQAPHRKPDVGFNPGSPESGSGLKAVLNRQATQAAPIMISR